MDDQRFDPFDLGRLHGKVESLEERVDRTEVLLTSMDGKLDTIQTSLAIATGGRERMASLIKYATAFLAALGTFGGIVVAGLHFITLGIRN